MAQGLKCIYELKRVGRPVFWTFYPPSLSYASTLQRAAADFALPNLASDTVGLRSRSFILPNPIEPQHNFAIGAGLYYSDRNLFFYFSPMCGHKGLCSLVSLLVVIGAVNWGLIGLGGFAGSDWNVVHMLLGQWPTVEWVVYILVGLCGLSYLGMWCKMGKDCMCNKKM